MSRKQKWQEALVVYPKTHKLTQKKKRKVDTPTSQEPGPARVAVTSGVDQLGISRKNTVSIKSNSSATRGSAGSANGSYSSCPSCSISKSASSKISESVSGSTSRHGSACKAMVEKTPTGRSWRCQEEQQQRIGGGRRTLPSSRSSPSISTSSSLCSLSPSMSGSASLDQLSQTISRDDAQQFLLHSGPKSRAESGCSSLEKNIPATDSWQPSLSLSSVSPRDPLRFVFLPINGPLASPVSSSSSGCSSSSSPCPQVQIGRSPMGSRCSATSTSFGWLRGESTRGMVKVDKGRAEDQGDDPRGPSVGRPKYVWLADVHRTRRLDDRETMGAFGAQAGSLVQGRADSPGRDQLNKLFVLERRSLEPHQPCHSALLGLIPFQTIRQPQHGAPAITPTLPNPLLSSQVVSTYYFASAFLIITMLKRHY